MSRIGKWSYGLLTYCTLNLFHQRSQGDLPTETTQWPPGAPKSNAEPHIYVLDDKKDRNPYGKYIPYQDNPTYFCWLYIPILSHYVPSVLVPFSHVGCFSHCWTLLTPLIPIRIGRACSWYLHGNRQKRPACVDASGWVSQESDVIRVIRFWKPLHVEKMWRNAKLYLIKTPAGYGLWKPFKQFEGTQKNFKVGGLVKIHGLQPVWRGYQEPKQVGTRIAREVGPWKN